MPVTLYFIGVFVTFRAGRNLSRRKEHSKHMANLVRPLIFALNIFLRRFSINPTVFSC